MNPYARRRPHVPKVWAEGAALSARLVTRNWVRQVKAGQQGLLICTANECRLNIDTKVGWRGIERTQPLWCGQQKRQRNIESFIPRRFRVRFAGEGLGHPKW